MDAPPRLLVFIVAYEAERFILDVIRRIPAHIFEKYFYEILVIDDASTDQTFAVAENFAETQPNLHLTVRRNKRNVGYGGNQKLGYRYALDQGFDYVILLHGDGQYAPEYIAQMLAPLEGGSDMVMGSRMLISGAALKGGMPMYKFVGNKVLTHIQNRLLCTQLTEFHSGFRAFRVTLLRHIPFEKNTPNFHFDTQIIIQTLFCGGDIKEVAIPTFYGEEISYVNSITYGLKILYFSLRGFLHKRKIWNCPLFDLPHFQR